MTHYNTIVWRCAVLCLATLCIVLLTYMILGVGQYASECDGKLREVDTSSLAFVRTPGFMTPRSENGDQRQRVLTYTRDMLLALRDSGVAPPLNLSLQTTISTTTDSKHARRKETGKVVSGSAYEEEKRHYKDKIEKYFNCTNNKTLWDTMTSAINMNCTRKPIHITNEQAFADEMNYFYRCFDTQDSSSRCT